MGMESNMTLSLSNFDFLIFPICMEPCRCPDSLELQRSRFLRLDHTEKAEHRLVIGVHGLCKLLSLIR
jgi:hypothetical protein